MEAKLGVELEAGMRDACGPVNVLEKLNGGIRLGEPFHEVAGELGMYAVEFVTPVCRSVEQVFRTLKQCERALPSGLIPVYEACPFGLDVPITEARFKPRYQLVREALMREHWNGASVLKSVAPWCSTQFHTWTGDVRSKPSVLLQNVLSNSGGYSRQQVIERFRIKGAEKHMLLAWHEWSIDKRVPASRWFNTPEEMIRFIESIPKLVEQAEDGTWRVAHNVPSRLGDLASEGTIWWDTRPRLYETLEWRVFPSMPISKVRTLSGHIFALTAAYWEYVAKNPSVVDLPREAMGPLYRYLSERSYLIPPKPLTDDEWNRLYRL